jgi:formate dehydrogenase major subunit
MATLMLLLGKLGVDGSGLAIISSQCNQTGMKVTGYDRHLLPGGRPVGDARALKEVSTLWQKDISGAIEISGHNISRKMQDDNIRAAFIFGENPAKDPQFNAFIDHLDFLVVCDMFKNETVQMADVFLPMASYLESKGHFTNWSGIKQFTTPIGEPLNDKSNMEIFTKLNESLGYKRAINSFEELSSEINYMQDNAGVQIPLCSPFSTPDGKAHFVLYTTEMSTTPAKQTHILEIDARIANRTKLIKA